MWPICGRRNSEDEYQSCYADLDVDPITGSTILPHDGPCVFKDDLVPITRRDLDELRADRERLEWYFSFDPAKPSSFLGTYFQGMRERWSVDQWRAAIDAARADGGNGG